MIEGSICFWIDEINVIKKLEEDIISGDHYVKKFIDWREGDGATLETEGVLNLHHEKLPEKLAFASNILYLYIVFQGTKIIIRIQQKIKYRKFFLILPFPEEFLFTAFFIAVK